MPDRSQPEFWGYPPFGDSEDLDAWLAGYTMVTSPAVDDALTALLAPPSRGELVDEQLALAEFRRINDRRSRPARSRRPSRRAAPSLMWLGTAAALLIVAVFGAATVTGRIPNPIQDIAHVVFASHSSDVPTDPAHKVTHADPATSTNAAARPLPTPDASSARTRDPHPTTPAPTTRPAGRKSPPNWFRNRSGSEGTSASPGASAPSAPSAARGTAYITEGANGGVGQADAWSAGVWPSPASLSPTLATAQSGSGSGSRHWSGHWGHPDRRSGGRRR